VNSFFVSLKARIWKVKREKENERGEVLLLCFDRMNETNAVSILPSLNLLFFATVPLCISFALHSLHPVNTKSFDKICSDFYMYFVYSCYSCENFFYYLALLFNDTGRGRSSDSFCR
jgi:hypothetical protein